MMIESKPQATEDQPERKPASMEASEFRQEDTPFYIVPPPPIPGKTGWSIVPW